MAEEHGGGSLSQKFWNAAKHTFSIGMIVMMASMALPAVAAAAAPGAATIGDMGMSVLGHYGTMFTAPFTEFGTITDIFNNTFSGNFAPSAVTGIELGGHAGHAAAAGTAAHTAGHSAVAASGAGAHAAMGHGAAAACDFTSWQSGLSAGDLSSLQGEASAFGMGLQEYYSSNVCMDHG